MKKLLIGLILSTLSLGAWAQPPGPDDQNGFDPPPPGPEMASDRWHPPGPPGPPGFHPPMGPMNPERILEFLVRNYPEKAQELQQLKTQKPEEYRRGLGALQRELGPLLPLQNADPQKFAERLAEFKLNDKVRSLSRGYKEASATQKSAIQEQLKPLLEQQFQSRQNRERQRLQHLKEMVQRMESRLKEREGKRAQIIEHHLDELTSGQELRW